MAEQAKSGESDDSQWFDLMPSFFAQPIRVEWEKDTKAVVLPVNIADMLIQRGYARLMTASEARAYDKRLGKTERDRTDKPPANKGDSNG
jgi:hypothetical protein